MLFLLLLVNNNKQYNWDQPKYPSINKFMLVQWDTMKLFKKCKEGEGGKKCKEALHALL